jgi:hypothetical protein
VIVAFTRNDTNTQIQHSQPTAKQPLAQYAVNGRLTYQAQPFFEPPSFSIAIMERHVCSFADCTVTPLTATVTCPASRKVVVHFSMLFLLIGSCGRKVSDHRIAFQHFHLLLMRALARVLDLIRVQSITCLFSVLDAVVSRSDSRARNLLRTSRRL